MCLEIFELESVHFLSAPGLTWQAALKKATIIIKLLVDIDILLMIEKGNRGRINLNEKIKNHYSLCIGMLQKLPTESFQWIGKTSQFNEVCVKMLETANWMIKDLFRIFNYN